MHVQFGLNHGLRVEMAIKIYLYTYTFTVYTIYLERESYDSNLTNVFYTLSCILILKINLPYWYASFGSTAP